MKAGEPMIEFILDAMNVSGQARQIQAIQTKHRLQLIDNWGITKGARILEVGCGQCDTTAALAYVVGEQGFVHGIDTAPPDYGAPITLGQARHTLLESPLSSRIQVDFETDLLALALPTATYDYIVFSHCSWYFSSKKQLQQAFAKARKLGKRLCFAEWDLRLEFPEQQAHFLAATIQAQCSAFHLNTSSNIQTLFTRYDIHQLLTETGWQITSQGSLFSSDLQDGHWEAALVRAEYRQLIETAANLPDKLKVLLLSELSLLENNDPSLINSLSVFFMTAE